MIVVVCDQRHLWELVRDHGGAPVGRCVVDDKNVEIDSRGATKGSQTLAKEIDNVVRDHNDGDPRAHWASIAPYRPETSMNGNAPRVIDSQRGDPGCVA